uniref:Uncharacterized protein n=1 Tax=Nymphaea colorata TaxID=210225 RepID=A0A5K1AC70_9MAGN
MGGPYWDVKLGRRDARTAIKLLPTQAFLPQPAASVNSSLASKLRAFLPMKWLP